LGAGGSDTDRGESVCTDPAGNILCAGYFDSPAITFGTVQLDNALMNFTSDVFVVKADGAGEVLWALREGGPGDQGATAIATNDLGEAFVAGYFAGTMQLGATVLTSLGDLDMFLVKYDADGTVLWAQAAGGAGSCIPSSLAIDAAGNIAVAGYFGGVSMSVGTDVLLNADPSRTDVFLAKYSEAGTPLWARRAGGDDDDTGRDVAIDAEDNLIMTGHYESGSIDFGTGALMNANDNYSDLFLVKYDATGTAQWAKRAGGILQELAWAVDVDGNGDIVMAGHFDDATLDIDGTVLTNTTAADYHDVFVAKFSAAGVLQWAQSGGGLRDEYVTSLDIDATGNILLAGSSDSDAPVFGSGSFLGTGGFDLFVVKYNTDGIAQWARNGEGGGDDRCLSVATDALGEVVLTGYSSSDPLVLGSATLGGAGDGDIWIAKLGGPTGLAEATAYPLVMIHQGEAHGELVVSSPERIKMLRVFDSMGRLVFSAAPNTALLTIQLQANGAYGVQVMTDRGQRSIRTVVD
jgi:hypothetical protein